MNAILTSLELDKEDISSKLICIIEEGLCDSNFVISSFISNAVRSENTGLCLVSFHRSFDHYNFVGIKSGYNLSLCLQKGSFIHIDVSKEILDKLDNCDLSNLIDECYVKEIASRIKSTVELLTSKFEKVVLILDSASDVISCGCSLENVITFVHHIRQLISQFNNTVAIVGAQFNEEDREKKLLKNYLMNSSDCRIVVAPLKTGFSTEVSGCIRYSKRDDSLIGTWTMEQLHHFKVTDRNVKVFAPGSLSV